MQQIIDFLNKNKVGTLATVEGDKPHLRPWGFMFEDNGKFWFLTANNKKVFHQLEENPNIEFCACAIDCSHVRLSGKVHFHNDIAILNRMFEEWKMLKDYYQTPENTLLEAFYIDHGLASISSEGENKIEFFDF